MDIMLLIRFSCNLPLILLISLPLCGHHIQSSRSHQTSDLLRFLLCSDLFTRPLNCVTDAKL